MNNYNFSVKSFSRALAVFFGFPILSFIAGPFVIVFISLWFFIPGSFFGKPYFEGEIGYSASGWVGMLLTIAFYFELALICGFLFVVNSRKANDHTEPTIRTKAEILPMVFVILLPILMATPLVYQHRLGSEKLVRELEKENYKVNDIVENYPEVEGPYTIESNTGKIKVKTKGSWKITQGKLIIVSDEIELRHANLMCGERCWSKFDLKFGLSSDTNAAYRERLNPNFISKQISIPKWENKTEALTLPGIQFEIPLLMPTEISLVHNDRYFRATSQKAVDLNMLSDYRLAFTIEQSSGGINYVESDSNVFYLPLLNKGLVLDACSGLKDIAQAINRKCYEMIEPMLSNDLTDDTIKLVLANDDAKILDMALKKYPQVNATDKNGMTLLMQAVFFGAPRCVKTLIGLGANVNAPIAAKKEGSNQNDLGRTALHLAAQNGEAESVEALLKGGANADLADAYGWTPKWYAVASNNQQTIRKFIENGMSPNERLKIKNQFGKTLLMLAIEYDLRSAAKTLIEKNADKSLRDDRGYSATDYANYYKRPELTKLLYTN
jgi:hypothetical protein